MTTTTTGNGMVHNADPVSQPAMAALCSALEQVLGVAPTPPAQVVLRWGDTSIEVAWPTAPAPPTAPVAVASDSSTASDVDPVSGGQFVLPAPLVGTFYRCPELGAPAFVEINDVVRPGQQIAIVEAMKLMNAIEADRAGRVADILVADGTAVEYGQTLFILESIEED